MFSIILIIVFAVVGIFLGLLSLSENEVIEWDGTIYGELVYNQKQIHTKQEKDEEIKLVYRLLLITPIYTRLKNRLRLFFKRTGLAHDLCDYKNYACQTMVGLRQLSAYKTEDVVPNKEEIKKWHNHVENNKAKMDEIENRFKRLLLNKNEK